MTRTSKETSYKLKNERKNVRLTPMQRQILAIFIHYEGEEICPVDLIKNTKFNPKSVYTVLYWLKKAGLIRVSRRFGKNVLYTLVDKTKALLALEGKTSYDLGPPPRTPHFQWNYVLDFKSSIYVGQTIDIRVDAYIGDILRNSGLFKAPGRRDRAKQYSYSCNEFSLSLSKYNSLRIIFKVPEITPLVRFLKDLKVDEFNIKILLDRIVSRLEDSRLEVEIPLKEKIPPFTIKTKVGDKVLTSKIVRSHFPQGELEIKGNALLVQNFINALVGVQHFSALDYANFSEVQKLNANFLALARGFRDIIDALERSALATQPATNQNQKKEVPSYYG